MKHWYYFPPALFLVLGLLASALAAAAAPMIAPQPSSVTTWAMAGANPQRTSWVPEDIPGQLDAEWVKPLDAYVPQRAQVIGAEGKVFVSTAKGLYAFDAATGADVWVYPTTLPLGHSPTYDNGKLFVAGFDRKVHAINALDGKVAWTFSAAGAFETNPLVVAGRVYLGDREGYMYALNASDGTMVWKYKAGGAILQSAAYASTSTGAKIVFGAMDATGYALDALTGTLAWQTVKLPGMGWHSWWPVVYQDKVIFTRTRFEQALRQAEGGWVFADTTTGNLPGVMLPQSEWLSGHPTIDVATNPNGKAIADYFEQYPLRRNLIVLSLANGEEIRFDIDNDGIVDAAPALMAWTSGGTSYPPIVSGYDGRLYLRGLNHASGAIHGAMLSGWEPGTSKLSYPVSMMPGGSPDWPADEPTGFSAAGSKVYWNLCCDRFSGAADLAAPNTAFPSNSPARQWRYISGPKNPPASSLPTGYNKQAEQYYWHSPDPAVYWGHGDNVGPAIYSGRMYVVRSNALIAFGPTGAGQSAPVLPSAKMQDAPDVAAPVSTVAVQNRLAMEVQRIVAAGHLKPSYTRAGYITVQLEHQLDDFGNDLWHNPADVHYYLLRALPHLDATLQQAVKDYLQAEMSAYPPYKYGHVGWLDGAQRDPFVYPPEDGTTFEANFGARTASNGFAGWSLPPHNVYALWKYALAGLGSPASLFAQVKTKLATVPSDAYLTANPHVHNSYIAGLWGYVALAKLASEPVTTYQSREAELNRLLALRAATFTTVPIAKDSSQKSYFYSALTAWNFMYLTPELADYLRQNALPKAQEAISTYETIAPYWMYAVNKETQGENGLQIYQQTHSLFQAKALISRESQGALGRYLDSPIVPTGDLYFVDNLVSLLDAPGPASSLDAPAPASSLDAPALVSSLDAPAPASSLDAPANDLPQPLYTIQLSPVVKGGPAASLAAPRVNLAFSPGNLDWGRAPIFWFGKATLNDNYVDVRVAYDSQALHVYPNIVDYHLWYEAKGGSDPRLYDSVSVLLDNGAGASYQFLSGARSPTQPGELWRRQARYVDGKWDWTWAPAQPWSDFVGLRYFKSGPNDNIDLDAGWKTVLIIPWTTLGRSGPPGPGETWRLAVRLYDRDGATAGVTQTIWPQTFSDGTPATWGSLAFSPAPFAKSALPASGKTVLQRGLNGSIVHDNHVGATGYCDGGKFGGGDKAYPDSTALFVQSQSDLSDFNCFTKTFLKFDLSGIPAGKEITSATLRLYQFGNSDPTKALPSLVQLFSVGDDWNASTLTWNNAPSAKENIAATTVPVLPSGSKWPGIPADWDATQAVVDAYAKGAPVNLALYEADMAQHSGKYFSSSDVGDWNAIARPSLTIEWADR